MYMDINIASSSKVNRDYFDFVFLKNSRECRGCPAGVSIGGLEECSSSRWRISVRLLKPLLYFLGSEYDFKKRRRPLDRTPSISQ